MTDKEKVEDLLTELVDMIDNGSQRDLDRADELSKSILKVIEKKPCCDFIKFKMDIKTVLKKPKNVKKHTRLLWNI